MHLLVYFIFSSSPDFIKVGFFLAQYTPSLKLIIFIQNSVRFKPKV